MTCLLAVAGKGGVGKTTCAALLARALVAADFRPILAVDADPNSNLHLLLGFPMPVPLGTLREEFLKRRDGSAPGDTLLDAMVQRRVAEGKDVDLVTMGRGEGPGCYCYVNNLLRHSLLRLSGNYRAVVVDNEAGMEHLSRGNLRKIDHLVLVADPSPRGLSAARAIGELALQLSLPVGKTWLLLNRAYSGRDSTACPPMEGSGRGGPALPPFPLLAEIPHDPSLAEWENAGRSFLDLPDGAAAAAAAAAVRILASGDAA